MKYVVGIDIGTGSVKAVAVDVDGKPLKSTKQYYGFDSPKPGYHEQDPAKICQAFAAALQELIEDMEAQPSGIGISSAMHSLIAVDELGEALAPMITWADSRSSDIADRLRVTQEGMQIYRSTGTPIHAMSPLCKLIWIKENNQELFQSTYKFISIKEYIWHKLFNEFKVDESIASCTGLYNIHELCWNEQSLVLAGINNRLLSEAVETDYTKHHQGNLLEFLAIGIPITIGASDGCLANLGSMAHIPGTAAMTIGTSGALRLASSKPLLDERSMTFSYVLDRNTFICGGPINNGGIALQWWLKNNTQSEMDTQSYEEAIAEIAEIPAGSKGLIFLPYLTGERAPIWDSESCGVFFGMRLIHTKAYFLRSILEGICFAMKDVLSTIASHHIPVTTVHVSGGFVTSKLWLQLMADITGENLVLIQEEDASAVGAALITLKSIGFIEDYPICESSGNETIRPDEKNRRVYDEYFSVYKQLYLDLRQTMHRAYTINSQIGQET